MALSLVTAPTTEPLTRGDAKLHLKIDSTTDDLLIDDLLQAAREYSETFTRRQLMTQTWDLKRDGFPCDDDAIVLPSPPVASVTSVTYVDTNGDSQTWAAGSTGYTTDLPSGPQCSPARIYPSYGVVYPQTRAQPNAVIVRFVCGYGTTAASVPAGILAAQKLLLGHWYLGREAAGAVDVSVIPFGVDALLYPYRVWL